MITKPTSIKIGRRNAGAVYELAGGVKAFMAWRRVADVYHFPEKSIAEAIRKGTACWSVETAVVIDMRAKGVAFIGVIVQDTGERYMAPIEAFFDLQCKTVMIRGRSGTHRCVSIQRFQRRAGKIVKRR